MSTRPEPIAVVTPRRTGPEHTVFLQKNTEGLNLSIPADILAGTRIVKGRSMRVVSRGLVFDVAGRPVDEQVTFFDSLYRLQTGVWLCGYTIGRKKHDPQGTLRLSRSSDDGATWSEIPFRFTTTFEGVKGSLAGAEFIELSPGRLLLFTTWFDRTDPERPLFDPVTEGILHSKLLVAESKDDGETFGPWREIPTPGLTGTTLCGPPLHWSDGGQTFPRTYLVAEDPRHDVFYWDERLCATPTGGEFVGLFWTHDRSARKDRNVHFLRGSLRDDDRARTAPRDTGIPGQIASPVVLDDGRYLGFVVDRDRPGTMKLWQSHDGGRTWPASESLTVYVHDERAALTQGKEGIDFAAYWEDMAKWSFGHPAARLINPREVLLTYYAGPPDHLSIHWARVELN